MFEVVIMLIIGAVVVGIYVMLTTDVTSAPEVPVEKPSTFQWSWGSLNGTDDNPSQIVMLPHGELGYRNGNGYDLHGNHFATSANSFVNSSMWDRNSSMWNRR